MVPIRFSRKLTVILILCQLITISLIRLPFWLIYYSRRQNRPRKSWTLRRTIIVQIVRSLVSKFLFKLSLLDRRERSLEVPQEELEPLNARFVWIPELGEENIVGVVAEHADRVGVKSIVIPAYWMLKEGTKWSPEYDKAGEGEKVMLYFHGGGFVVGSAHPSLPTASLPKGSLKYSASLSRVLSVEYRLSAGPPIFDRRENPFPTAVIDGIAAYKYLVCEIGFLPQNIIVAGDSAGGNIALAVVRYAVESHLPDLPPPGGLIAASTPADLSYSRVGTNSSHYLNAASDIFDISPNTHFSSAKRSTFDAYIGEMDPEEIKHNRYLSPSSKFVVPPQSEVGENAKLFSGFPRSYIIGGGAELMLDDIVALAERMKDDGVDVETDFPPDAVHVYFLFPWHEPERTEAFIKCAAWLDGGHAITIVVE